MSDSGRWKEDVPCRPLNIVKPDTNDMTPDELKTIGYIKAFAMKIGLGARTAGGSHHFELPRMIGLFDEFGQMLSNDPALIRKLPEAPSTFAIYTGADDTFWYALGKLLAYLSHEEE